MRTQLALTFALATLASPAAAQSGMDRYGYGPAAQSASRANPSSPDRRFLTWSNKGEGVAEAYAQGAQSHPSQSYQAFQPQAPYEPHAPQRYAALTPPARAPLQQLPPPYAAERWQPPVELAGGPSEPDPVPVRAAPPPTRPVAQAAIGASGQARYYSLHREYGLTPDAIPEQALGNNYVLIGPSSGGGLGKDPDDDSRDEKPEKAF